MLNFTGLLVLYFSLREQFAANQLQIRELTTQRDTATNEANFNMSLLLLDKLILSTKDSQDNIHRFRNRLSSTTGRGDDILPAIRDFLKQQFLSTSYLFTYIANTVDKDNLTSNQLKVISGLLLSFYMPYLKSMQQQLKEAGDSTTLALVEQQIHLIINDIRSKANQ